jgi:hypothetical protein
MTGKKIRFFIISTAVIAISLLYFFVDARVPGFFPKCPFHSLTGLFCPGCGSQRALSSLLHFDISSALRYNMLMVAAVPLILYSAGVTTLNTFRQKQIAQRVFHSVPFIWMVAVIVVLFWVLRNFQVYPLDLLAPPS